LEQFTIPLVGKHIQVFFYLLDSAIFIDPMMLGDRIAYVKPKNSDQISANIGVSDFGYEIFFSIRTQEKKGGSHATQVDSHRHSRSLHLDNIAVLDRN
jgi:hypothetical protein